MAEPTPPTLPSELPVLPLRRTVAFPLTLQPLAVNRPVSIETVNRALGADRLVLLLLQDNDADDPTPQDVRRIRHGSSYSPDGESRRRHQHHH